MEANGPNLWKTVCNMAHEMIPLRCSCPCFFSLAFAQPTGIDPIMWRFPLPICRVSVEKILFVNFSCCRYGNIGLSGTLGDSFFRCIDSHSVIIALTENIQYMEFRHIKQLVHLALIPLVKCCPSDLWEVWLEKLLHPLLIHVGQALSSSWSGLLRDGKAKVPDFNGMLVGSDLKVEVMEEKLLRDLTREICSLFSVLAFPGFNAVVPSLEQVGQMSHSDDPSKRDLNAFASSSMVGYVH